MAPDPAAHPLLTPDPDVVAALEAAAPGAVAARASDRLSYAHDASHYLLTPAAVVTPRDAGEVAGLLRASRAVGVPLTFRSGGTSLSGQAGTHGVLVDTRRHFRSVEVLDDGARVRTGPGATLRAVNARLLPFGRKLGPDPASETACTIGGVVANNSSGMACGITTNTYRTLDSLVLVLPSGTVLDTGAPDADEQLAAEEPRIHAGLAALRDRVRADPASMATIARLFAIKNTMGYGLNSFVDHERPVDILERLVVGSEGTLAFVAQATFATVPVHPHVATGLLVFDDLAAATGSLPALVGCGFATVELLDATSLRVARRDPQATEALRTLTVHRHAALLVEFQEPTAEALAHRVDASRAVLDALPVVRPATLDDDPDERRRLWHIRKGLYATVAGSRPSGTTALLEDIAVPVERLLPTCESLVGLFATHGYDGSVIFGHAKDGNIHFMLGERFDRPDLVRRYLAFTEEMVALVLGQGGTLKAEHGTGRMMAPYVQRQYGPELYEVMRELKALLDPGTVLSPGVLLGDDPMAHVRHLKTTPTVEPEVDRCVDCGYCEPVCPSQDLTLTPRRRIALRREMATARQAGDEPLLARLQDEYEYDGVDTCAVDGMCGTACPVLIDTGDLVRRLREQEAAPAARRTWAAAAGHWDATTLAAARALTTAAGAPALAARAAGIARSVLGADTVPGWTPDLPAGGVRRRPRPSVAPRAVYFPACISTMFGPAEGGRGVSAAFLRLCARAGAEVRTPEGIAALCCGTPWKSKGMAEGYDRMREQVLPALWQASDRGALPVVVDAASCTEGLQQLTAAAQDHPGLTVIDAVAFVDEWVLPELVVRHRLASLAVHPTCSSTRLGTVAAMLRIAAAVADEVVVPEGWGCCAFAGDRGLLHPELTAAATAREAAAVTARTFTAYASTNRTCELGMTRATGHPYRHILELLDDATSD